MNPRYNDIISPKDIAIKMNLLLFLTNIQNVCFFKVLNTIYLHNL